LARTSSDMTCDITHDTTSADRRRFLKFLATSPYVAALGGIAAFLQRSAFAQDSGGAADVIASPAKAFDVFDFEGVARRNVLPGHWAYLTSGVDDDATVRINHEGYNHVQLHPRRLRDATKIDMHVDLFGTVHDSPIFLCPTGQERSVHPDGELAVARAAKARNTLQMLATSTTIPVEEVNKALGRPVWFQLYVPGTMEACEKMLRRVEDAGCTVVVVTVDNVIGRSAETYLRNRPKDLSSCAGCHEGEPGATTKSLPMFAGMTEVRRKSPAEDWATLDRVRKFWKGKLFIKGMDTREDARLCVEHGVDGMLVSNHGGRATETLRSTIEALPEVVAEVNGRIPVFVDGGVRRGTDVFKALALGAKAVGIGRPFLWGLGAFGQAGVDRVIEILNGELKLVMGNCGTRTVADITGSYVTTPDWKT
jgi:4-hydroxymandelate oxidase